MNATIVRLKIASKATRLPMFRKDTRTPNAAVTRMAFVGTSNRLSIVANQSE